MSTLHIMLHDDWELCGDGSGDFHKLMLNPAEKILACCNDFGAKYTLFAEFGQQLSMEKVNDPLFSESANAWKEFLCKAVSAGHDVQLHFHPQWIGAEYRNGSWTLDFRKWSVAQLGFAEIKTWLQKGKNYLEKLLCPIKPSFRVVAHRAGGWMAQPSENLIKALLDIGIIADCSVIKGLSEGNPIHGSIDFQYAPSALIPWYADKHDVAKMNDKPVGLICIPTFARTVYLPKPLAEVLINPTSFFWGLKRNLHFLEKRKDYRSMESFKTIKMPFEKSAHFKWIQRLFAPRVIKLDFGVYHYKTITKMIKTILRTLEDQCISEAPLILYAHSKDFYSLDNFKRLLSELKALPNVCFTSTQHAVEYIDKSLVLYKEKFPV